MPWSQSEFAHAERATTHGHGWRHRRRRHRHPRLARMARAVRGAGILRDPLRPLVIELGPLAALELAAGVDRGRASPSPSRPSLCTPRAQDQQFDVLGELAVTTPHEQRTRCDGPARATAAAWRTRGTRRKGASVDVPRPGYRSIENRNLVLEPSRKQSPEREIRKGEDHAVDPPSPRRERRDTSIGALHLARREPRAWLVYEWTSGDRGACACRSSRAPPPPAPRPSIRGEARSGWRRLRPAPGGVSVWRPR